jgi:hypothetical protein
MSMTETFILKCVTINVIVVLSVSCLCSVNSMMFSEVQVEMLSEWK